MFKTLVTILLLLFLCSTAYPCDLWLSTSTIEYIQIKDSQYVLKSYPTMKDCKKAEVVIQDNCETLAALGGKIKLTCEVGHIKASDGKSEINYRYQCIEVRNDGLLDKLGEYQTNLRAKELSLK